MALPLPVHLASFLGYTDQEIELLKTLPQENPLWHKLEDFHYSSPYFLLKKYAKTGSVELVRHILSSLKKIEGYYSYILTRAFLLTGQKEYLEKSNDELFVHYALAKGITRDDFVVKDVTPFITSDKTNIRYTLLTAEIYENDSYLKEFEDCNFCLTSREILTDLEEHGISKRFRSYRMMLQGKYAWCKDDDLMALILLKLEKKGELSLDKKQTNFVLATLSKSASERTIEWCVKHEKYIEVLEEYQSKTYVAAALRQEKFHLLEGLEIDIPYDTMIELSAMNYRVYRYLQEKGHDIGKDDLLNVASNKKNHNLVTLLGK